MRISTSMLHQQGVENMQRQQALLAQTQNQIASGQRLTSAAADPAGWSAAASLDQTLAQNAGYLANAGTAADRLGYEDNALASVSEILTRARELALQVNGGTLDDSQRRMIATELQSLRQSLLDIANSTDAEGRYLFAGSASSSAPFTLAADGSAVYGGDQSARELQISAQRSVADGDAGSEVFQRLRSGNGSFTIAAAANSGGAFPAGTRLYDAAQWDGGTYQISFSGGSYEVRDSGNALIASGSYQENAALRFRGIELSFSGTPADGDRFEIAPSSAQDVFATLQQLIDFAQTPMATPAQRAQGQSRYFGALQALDAAQAHISDVRGSVGSRLNAIEDARLALDGNALLVQQQLATLRDLDYAEAASRLSLQQTLLQAAQLSYQRVQGLSLFDYLR